MRLSTGVKSPLASADDVVYRFDVSWPQIAGDGDEQVVKGDNRPIKRRKLSDDVKERLLETIQSESLGPGDILPSERELMNLYGVGRPAIREAMQALQGIGLIEVRHGERPRVATASMDGALEQLGLTMKHILSHSGTTLEHLKEARLGLETFLVGKAATVRTEKDIQRLSEALEKHRKARHDPVEFILRDGKFHQAIAEIVDNPLYATVTHAIFEWLSVFHIGTVRRPGFEDVALSEHEEIFDAIRKGSPEKAREAMESHLLRSNALFARANAKAPVKDG